MTRIFSQNTAVIGNPLWRPFPTFEVCSQTTQHEREAHRKTAVPNVADEIGETPVITTWCTGI